MNRKRGRGKMKEAGRTGDYVKIEKQGKEIKKDEKGKVQNA